MKKAFYATSFDDLRELLLNNNLNPHAASTLHNWHFKKKKVEACPENISLKTKGFVNDNFHFHLPKLESVLQSEDRTVKLIFKLTCGQKIESVLIPFNKKYTICLSSQAGCAMKCSFCFTGVQGFKRSLLAHEIVGQYLEAWRWLKQNRLGEERILNIVFMGQGEPLHNFNEVKKSCEIFLSTHGLSIGSQKITISTSGYLPGLKKWNKEMPPVNLALSLHSPFDEKRTQLIPINKKYPLKGVINSIDALKLQKKQFITYEYLLIYDFNDAQIDAHEVGQLLAGKRAYVNLIPFNPFPGSQYKRPPLQTVKVFKKILDTYKIPTLIRDTKGDDVLAACGQLNTSIN